MKDDEQVFSGALPALRESCIYMGNVNELLTCVYISSFTYEVDPQCVVSNSLAEFMRLLDTKEILMNERTVNGVPVIVLCRRKGKEMRMSAMSPAAKCDMYGDLIVFKRAYDEVTGLPKLASLTKQEVAAIRQHIVIGKVTLKDGSEVYTNILITTKAEVAE